MKKRGKKKNSQSCFERVCATNAKRYGWEQKKFGHKRFFSRAEKKRSSSRKRLQLVDVFITMDSGGVFIFTFASEEDEEEEATEKKETK